VSTPESTATIAARAPASVDVEAGKDYYWCACGRSANQPFCDGSHKDTAFTPLRFSVEGAAKKFLCQCKRTANPPYCDGTHNSLTDDAG
jgi:CDGSH-type Zn-finger protein